MNIDFETGQIVWLAKGDLPGAERGLVKGEVAGYKILSENHATLKAKLSTTGKNRNFTIYRKNSNLNHVFLEMDEKKALKKAQEFLRFNLKFLSGKRAENLRRQLI